MKLQVANFTNLLTYTAKTFIFKTLFNQSSLFDNASDIDEEQVIFYVTVILIKNFQHFLFAITWNFLPPFWANVPQP